MSASSPQHVLGSYVIERELGRGGMGAIYLGTHRTLGKRAAIKVLLPELSRREDLIARFWAEARAVTAIKHPSIVDVYDVGVTDDGRTFIVMEYLEGESLGARLKTHGLLPIPQAVGIARQIANALSAAHAVGVVHRDLKPDNVFLVDDPEVAGGRRAKLLDFGVAKLALADDDSTAKTITGALLGTPHYMSPEQCEGARAVDHRSDLYSLGCTLFQMVAGRLPFESPGIGGLIGMHLHVPPPRLRDRAPHASRALERIVARLLEKSPDARYASAGEVAAALSVAEASEVDAAASAPLPQQIVQAELETAVSRFVDPPPKIEPPRPPPKGKTRWAWLSASVGLLGVVAIAVAVARRQPSPRAPDPGPNTSLTPDADDTRARDPDTPPPPDATVASDDPGDLVAQLLAASDRRAWMEVGELARRLEAAGLPRDKLDALLAKFARQAAKDIEAQIEVLVNADDCVSAIAEAQKFALGWGAKIAGKAMKLATECEVDDSEHQSEVLDDVAEAFGEGRYRVALAKCKQQRRMGRELRLVCIRAACEMKQRPLADEWVKPLDTADRAKVLAGCATAAE